MGKWVEGGYMGGCVANPWFRSGQGVGFGFTWSLGQLSEAFSELN